MRKLFAGALAVLLAALGVWRLAARPTISRAAPPFNVILIVVDSVAAKHFASFGGESSVSPFIDDLAGKGVRFMRAYTPAPWTAPAITSMLTARMPSVHGVIATNREVRPGIRTMAEMLRDAGYDTAGFVSHRMLTRIRSFARGFGEYRQVKLRGGVHDSVTSDQVTDEAIGWLEGRAPARRTAPFFLFLHYFDPHYNYQHHAEFDRSSWYQGPLRPGVHIKRLQEQTARLSPEDARYLRDLHSEEISLTDREIERLWRFLEREGAADNTMLIFVGDHGEEFLEHKGLGHGRTMYEEVLRVPLFFYYPPLLERRKVNQPVSSMDILPTLLGLLGVPAEHGRTADPCGIPLPLAEAAPIEKRLLVSEVDFNALKLAAREGEDKLILDKPAGRWELYNLAEDPVEQVNRFGKGAPREAELRRGLEGYRAAFQKEDRQIPISDSEEFRQNLDAEELKNLESLGYM